MKLALIRQQYNPFGGAEVFVARTLQAWAGEDAVNLHVLARSWQRADAQPTAINAVLHPINPFYRGRLWRDVSFARAVQQHLSAHPNDYDIVQAHERIPGSMIYRAGDGVHRDWLDVLSTLRSPLAARWLKHSPYHRYTVQAETVMFQHPALKIVVCNSPMVRDALKRHFPALTPKLRLVYNGVDTARFSPQVAENTTNTDTLRDDPIRTRLMAIAEQGFTVIFVGSGFERKGLASAIRAVAAVVQTQLIVVGADKRHLHYQCLAEQLGAGARIHFFGAQKNLPLFYRHSEALIFPTHYEPFGNVVLEALACGLPVLTSPSNGASVLIDEAKSTNGQVIEATDVAGYVQALKQLQDAPRRRDMALSARESALPYTFSAMRQAMMAVYQEVSG